MRRFTGRQAVNVVLVLCLLTVLAPTAWSQVRKVRTQAQLNEAARYLRGVTIVVDPGHGGDDPGAVVGTAREKGIVLAIGHALKKRLEAEGARVVLTRDEDESLGGPIREELGRRVALIEEHHANLFISIHANKDSCRCWGAQTFYQREGMPAGKEMAVAIQNRLRSMTPTTRVALPANYFVLRTAPVPAAMVEVGFMTNAKELAQLQDTGYHETLATAITLGVGDFLRTQVPQGKAGGSLGQ